jgi:hypothetical protein
MSSMSSHTTSCLLGACRALLHGACGAFRALHYLMPVPIY